MESSQLLRWKERERQRRKKVQVPTPVWLQQKLLQTRQTKALSSQLLKLVDQTNSLWEQRPVQTKRKWKQKLFRTSSATGLTFVHAR